MRRGFATLAFAAVLAIGAVGYAAENGPPPWAFAANPLAPQPAAPVADDGTQKHVANSSVGLTLSQIKDPFNIPEWHPDNHPAAPDIVTHGRKPGVLGCGYCHLPNGLGRPENAALAGLPAAYITQQIADFRNGARNSAIPDLVPAKLMVGIAKAATDDDIKQAAEYFSGLSFTPWIRVVEAATVPKTHVAGYMLAPDAAGGSEPIGQRIVETPENLAETELRDSGSGFIAYVPPGSIKRGERLVMKGGAGKSMPCGTCHGIDLKGLGPVPPLAGRSPSYVVRQLYDMQHGNRAGLWSPLMVGVVRDLTPEDLVDIAAYTASRRP